MRKKQQKVSNFLKNSKDKDFAYIFIENDLSVFVINDFKITKIKNISLFKESQLISNYKDYIIDKRLSEMKDYYNTAINLNEFNINTFIRSIYINDNLANKLLDSLYKITKLKYQNSLKDIKKIVFNLDKIKNHKNIKSIIEKQFVSKEISYDIAQ